MSVFKYVNKSDLPLTVGTHIFTASGFLNYASTQSDLDVLDGISIDRYVDGVPTAQEYTPWHIYARDNIILPKTAGKGLQVDTDNPSHMWFDLIGEISVDVNNAVNRPDFNTYIDGIRQHQFAINDQVWINFHLTHDYLPGSDIYIHGHWSHNSAVEPTGQIGFGFDVSYAKGHNQESFNAPVTVSGTGSLVVPQYRHMISEFQLSNNGGTGGLLDSNRLEPDGILMVRAYLSSNTSAPAVDPFLHYVDVHYQSTGIGTKQKRQIFIIN